MGDRGADALPDPRELALRARAEAAAEAARAGDDDDGVGLVRADDPYVALLQRAMLGRLAAMGFSRAEARESLETCGWIEEDATYALLRSLQPPSVGDLDLGSIDAEEAMGERGEEAMALTAILEDSFRDLTGDFPDADGKMALEREQRRMWTADVPPPDDRWKPCVLEVHFPPGSVYPFEPPLLSIKQPNLPPPIRRVVAAQLAAQAASMTGEAVVYTLVAWVQEHMPAVLDEHGTMDAEAAERAAAAAAEEEARAEAEEAARVDPEVRLSGYSRLERTFARIEARQEEEDKEEEDRRRRMAYFRLLMSEEKAGAEEKAGSVSREEETRMRRHPKSPKPIRWTRSSSGGRRRTSGGWRPPRLTWTPPPPHLPPAESSCQTPPSPKVPKPRRSPPRRNGKPSRPRRLGKRRSCRRRRAGARRLARSSTPARATRMARTPRRNPGSRGSPNTSRTSASATTSASTAKTPGQPTRGARLHREREGVRGERRDGLR